MCDTMRPNNSYRSNSVDVKTAEYRQRYHTFDERRMEMRNLSVGQDLRNRKLFFFLSVNHEIRTHINACGHPHFYSNSMYTDFSEIADKLKSCTVRHMFKVQEYYAHSVR